MCLTVLLKVLVINIQKHNIRFHVLGWILKLNIVIVQKCVCCLFQHKQVLPTPTTLTTHHTTII